MSQKKNLQSKNTKTKPVQKNKDADNDTEVAELDDPKAKKGVDLEAALEPASVVDEKIEEDPLATNDDLEDEDEELSLDDDELNPFQDKWEQ